MSPSKDTNDETLLTLLRDAARTRARDEAEDARWRALADGTLDETAVRALQEEAKSCPEAAALYELFRPFDAEERARMEAAVHAQQDEEIKRARDDAK